MNGRRIAVVVKIVLVVGACCLCYGVAWMSQNVRHKKWKAEAHMQLRMDSQLVFKDLLPRFVTSLSKNEMEEFLSETEAVMMNYLVDGPTAEHEKMKRGKWRDKWVGRMKEMKTAPRPERCRVR